MSQWFKTIILVMILASLVEMLMPSRSMERYVRLVLSLTVLMAVLTPVFHLLNSQWLDEARFREWLAPHVDGAEASAWPQHAEPLLQLQQEQTIDLTERELAASIAAEVELRFPVAVEDVTVAVASSLTATDVVQIQSVELFLRPANIDDESGGAGASEDAMVFDADGLNIQVEPVDIRIFPQHESMEVKTQGVQQIDDGTLLRQVQSWLAHVYHVKEEQVAVRWMDGR